MVQFLIRQIASSSIIILLAVSGVIMMVHAIPGDPANVLLGPRATPEMKEVLRVDMGLDRPIPIQIGAFVWNVMHGNLGKDVVSKRPITTIVMEQLPYTLVLIFVSISAAAAIGIPLGCYSALRRNSWLDNVVGVFSVSALAVPSFIIAIYSVLLFSVYLKWLPSIGAGETGNIPDQLTHLILPAVSVGLNWIGYLARFVRSSMLDVLGEQHIKVARANGLTERTIVFKYALPLAVLPTITVIGVGMGHLLSAAVFTEIVFARPGIGKLLFDSISQRNSPVVLGVVLVTTILFVVCATLADVINALIDPRARDRN